MTKATRTRYSQDKITVMLLVAYCDDNGVSESTHLACLDLFEYTHPGIFEIVDATDGRYYIPYNKIGQGLLKSLK